jgi:hypothetical protein
MTTCEACGAEFTATRATARYCSTACRQRAHRDRVAAEDQPAGDGPLVAAVRADLTSLAQIDTAEGQLAVQLARGIERRPSAGLSAQLRELMGNARFKAAQQGLRL